MPTPPTPPYRRESLRRLIGVGLLSLALGGITPSLTPVVAMESSFYIASLRESIQTRLSPSKPLPASVPVQFNPLVASDGRTIVPNDTSFGIVIPKIGVNASVIPGVDPFKESDYDQALLTGVAHASTSYFPDEEGVVYLFSHSTNYEWFAKDLNAVFYLLKNLEAGDTIVLIYNPSTSSGHAPLKEHETTLYTYKLTEKRIVKPSETNYLQPIAGDRRLILQTCYPPGSTAERLLLIADLIDRQEYRK